MLLVRMQTDTVKCVCRAFLSAGKHGGIAPLLREKLTSPSLSGCSHYCVALCRIAIQSYHCPVYTCLTHTPRCSVSCVFRISTGLRLNSCLHPSGQRYVALLTAWWRILTTYRCYVLGCRTVCLRAPTANYNCIFSHYQSSVKC